MMLLPFATAHDCGPTGGCAHPSEEDWLPEGMGLSLLQFWSVRGRRPGHPTGTTRQGEDSSFHQKMRQTLQPEPPPSVMVAPARTAFETQIPARAGEAGEALATGHEVA